MWLKKCSSFIFYFCILFSFIKAAKEKAENKDVNPKTIENKKTVTNNVCERSTQTDNYYDSLKYGNLIINNEQGKDNEGTVKDTKGSVLVKDYVISKKFNDVFTYKEKINNYFDSDFTYSHEDDEAKEEEKKKSGNNKKEDKNYFADKKKIKEVNDKKENDKKNIDGNDKKEDDDDSDDELIILNPEEDIDMWFDYYDTFNVSETKVEGWKKVKKSEYLTFLKLYNRLPEEDRDPFY